MVRLTLTRFLMLPAVDRIMRILTSGKALNLEIYVVITQLVQLLKQFWVGVSCATYTYPKQFQHLNYNSTKSFEFCHSTWLL